MLMDRQPAGELGARRGSPRGAWSARSRAHRSRAICASGGAAPAPGCRRIVGGVAILGCSLDHPARHRPGQAEQTTAWGASRRPSIKVRLTWRRAAARSTKWCGSTADGMAGGPVMCSRVQFSSAKWSQPGQETEPLCSGPLRSAFNGCLINGSNCGQRSNID